MDSLKKRIIELKNIVDSAEFNKWNGNEKMEVTLEIKKLESKLFAICN